MLVNLTSSLTKLIMIKFLTLFLGIILAGTAIAQPQITYTLSMPQPHTHYFEVEMNVKGITSLAQNGYLDFKMPVWTPGSYFIREYSKNVEQFQAFSAGQVIKAEKIRKNAWRVFTSNDELTLKYKVYAYELSVRTSFLDDSHGYVNGATVFLFHDALKSFPSTVIIQPAEGWKKVNTGLKNIAPFTFQAADYDNLVDCPIEIGNHRTFTFTASGIQHTVAMYGEADVNESELASEMQRVCQSAASIIGEHPCEEYTFIIHNTNKSSGGLEHANSTTLGVNRTTYKSRQARQAFLELVAHEYFHLWNVKRLRPIALGPFDYENENYTHLLWVAEGFTVFYEAQILLRAGIITPDDYLKRLSSLITDLENTPGNTVQSVADASWDAWIKYYRPNENSTNSTVSYYDKGAVIGELMNLLIVAKTNGQKSLDDVMRYLYQEYYKTQKRGFKDDEMQKACELVAGTELNDFFQHYIYGTRPLPYLELLRPFGLELVDLNSNNQEPYLGVKATVNGSGTFISEVIRDSPAYHAGLNANDEIITINGERISNATPLKDIIETFKVGNTLAFTVSRSGLLKNITVTLTASPLRAYQLQPLRSPSESQKRLYERLLLLAPKK